MTQTHFPKRSEFLSITKLLVLGLLQMSIHSYTGAGEYLHMPKWVTWIPYVFSLFSLCKSNPTSSCWSRTFTLRTMGTTCLLVSGYGVQSALMAAIICSSTGPLLCPLARGQPLWNQHFQPWRVQSCKYGKHKIPWWVIGTDDKVESPPAFTFRLPDPYILSFEDDLDPLISSVYCIWRMPSHTVSISELVFQLYL